MTPQEKAKQLFDIMSSQTYCYQPYAGAHYNVEEIGWEAGKKCALIAIDEILISRPCLPICISTDGGSSEAIIDANNFWQEVKTEIERL